MIAAQRKVQALRAAAQADDPVAAILAIPTSRGNGYMNRADDYKTALLAHFGHTAAGAPASEAARPSGGRRGAEQVASAAPVAPPTPTPVRNGSALNLPGQDPTYAANLLRKTEQELGFTPRPNVPLDWTVRRDGVGLPSGRVVPWPNDKFKDLARRYLAQPSTLQMEAKNLQRQHQAALLNFMHPEIRAHLTRITADAEAERRLADAQHAQNMRTTRAAAASFLNELQSISALHKPQEQIGANVRQLDGNLESAAEFLGTSPEKLGQMAKAMVADYGAGEVFNIRVVTMRSAASSGQSVSVHFTGDSGTSITRKFTKSGDDIFVDHSFFRAGSRGNGSAKALFRVSLGVYKMLGVKKVKVHANIDVGGYAWAKFGFVPTQSSWEGLRGRMTEKLMRLSGVPADAKTRIKALLEKNDPKTLFALSDAKIGERSIGKEMLLGSDWYGALSLNDGDSYRRCVGYISQGRG